MLIKNNVKYFVCFVALLTMTGCVCAKKIDGEGMYPLGAALTKLSSAVESAVRYKNPPADLNDAELLAFATSHDPTLLAPFQQYSVLVLRADRHAIVLVCSDDKAVGLIEDAGCTTPMDLHLWERIPLPACAFTLQPSVVCPPLNR
jgi:hypothetical protein